MSGLWQAPGPHTTEPKDHRGVAAYWATTPIRVDMEGPFGPYNRITSSAASNLTNPEIKSRELNIIY